MIVMLTPPLHARRLHTTQDPWFLTDLPPGALAMNERCVAKTPPACGQSADEIKAVVHAAATSHVQLLATQTGES